MNILLTNDDGYLSEGINVLADKLSENSENKVFIVAPLTNRSCVSNHFTIFQKQTLVKIKENVWACDGYPTDCSAVALQSNLIDEKIDVVISGINHGSNLGTDIIYSGTCAAARHAVMVGYPAIAVSVVQDPDEKKPYKFNAIADFVVKNLKQLMQLCNLNDPKVFVNINACSLDKYEGAKLTEHLCCKDYQDRVEISNNCDSTQSAFWIFGKSIVSGEDDNDYALCHKGYIAVTRLYAECVAASLVDGVEFNL